jgi:hydrophobe/amphiphile efflux-3 (HAE3) family protein
LDRFFRVIAGRPWLVLAAVLGITLVLAYPLVDWEQRKLRLHIDMSTNRLLPEDDEGRKFYDYVRKAFGSDETMVVAVSADDIFTHEALSRVKRIAERAARVEGVHHVVAITNAANVRGSEDGIDVRPFLKEIPTDPAELADLKRQALANPIYAGNLISRDGRTAAIVVQFLNFSDADFIQRGIDDEIQRIAVEESGGNPVWVTGGPHLKVAQVRYQLGDLARAMPLIVLALAAVLAISFRTVRGVVLPVLAVAVSLLWTLGFSAWLGKPLTIVTVLVPPMLLILGVAYSVHVVSEYYDVMREDRRSSSPVVVAHALKLVWLAVVLTGLTTAAGFLSNALSPIRAIREFGWLSVAGVLATVVVTLTLTPALLSVLGRPRRLARSEVAEHGRFGRLMVWLAAFDLRNRRAIFVVWGIITAVSLLAATRLVVGNESLRFLPATSKQRLDFSAVNTHLEGANGFQVVIKAEGDANFKQPENLRALESIQEWLESQPEIGGTTGLVDFVKLLNRAFHADDPAKLAVPETERMTGQLLFLGASDELEGYVDARYQLTNIAVRARVFDTELIASLERRIQRKLDAELPPGLKGRVTGNTVLMGRVVDDLIRGQITSILGSLVLIYGLLWLMFLSWRLGLVALIPNVIPVAVYFGALGATGITLNFATSIIAPMALGVAVDDTIHYFSRFNSEAKRLANEERATISVLRSVGRPVLYSTISLCVGFLMLANSDLLSYRQVGGMGAFTLGFSLLVEMTLTPALCSGLRIVTLWDTLTLDLGADPQIAIPLFKGLSKAQCRIVALMANLRTVPAGTQLMHVGDAEQEMYVIVDGKLRIWKEGEHGPIDLRSCSRGDVVGEVGLFSGERSANADVAEDARLLRFTPNNLQRLRRRYPRIAATVLRNLNEILAQRLSSLTDRLR